MGARLGRRCRLPAPGGPARIARAATIAILTLVGGVGAFAQDSNYLRRFLEEAQKKPPPVVVPPPTPAMLTAPALPVAGPIDFAEARRLMGLDVAGAGASRLPGGKLAIIDAGFGGLRQWLDSRPDEARLVTVMRRTAGAAATFEADPAFTGEGEDDHGFKVYRVVRAILPDVPVILYNAPNIFDAGTAMLHGMVNGAVLFNISMAWTSAIDVFGEEEDLFAKQLRLYLPQYEAFAFIAAGNTRRSVHAWISADRNANGYVDLRERAVGGQDIDGARVLLRKGSNDIYFAWDIRSAPEADYEVELVLDSGERLAAAKASSRNPRKGFVALAHEAAQERPARLRIRRLAGPVAGVAMRLSAYPLGGAFGDFNGTQTALSYLFRENPFVVFVGSYGKASDGRLVPSSFSDIGVGVDGKAHPHVLGPGQLRLDGLDLQGTSYASPFLTALYATRVGFNVKNLIERSTTHARLSPAAADFERSRWGTPDAPKVATALREITGPTRIENVGHAVGADGLAVRFAITRCCMESLTWYVQVQLLDPATRRPFAGADGKPLAVEVALRKDEPDFVRHPVEARFPPAAVAALKGREVALGFSLRVRSWRAPPPGSIVIDEAPAYALTL